MNNYLNLLSIIMVLSSCGSTDEREALSDEKHRASDWQAHVEMTLELDTVNDGRSEAVVLESKTSRPFLELVDQLFDMSFSGDAHVYAPTLFGELDHDRRLDPKALVEELKDYDTITVEDIYGNEPRDTVVDLSFKKSTVSSLVIVLELGSAGETSVTPKYVALGKQVFDDETGEPRGVSNKFFIDVDRESDELKQPFDRLHLVSDSVGRMNLDRFIVYNEVSSEGISDVLRKTHPNAKLIEVSFDLHLSHADQRLYILNWKSVPYRGSDPV